MCGICGVLELEGGSANPALISSMMSAIVHRGPDGCGMYVDAEVGLGHRRLSIIDVASGGQPISNEDGTLQLVFNGEIYNFVELREELESRGHIFTTKSDTEVIVHAYEQWDVDCVNKFNGMFAFALWDSNRRTLFLARDHLGIKPLYYTIVKGKLLFASEIKALLVDPEVRREVDLRSLDKLFTLRYVPSPDTLFARIKKIPPGHTMTARNGRFSVTRFWTSKPLAIHSKATPELLEQYQSLVDDAIRLQMRSDVPVGLFLSSGIDSGAILAVMSKYAGTAVRTFTLGFEGGEGTNEVSGARQMADLYGARHTEWIIGASDYEKYYRRYLYDLEEPVGNETAAAFYFVSLMASRSVKVALTGQGADEPWAGYGRHLGMKLSGLWDALPGSRKLSPLVRFSQNFISNPRLVRGLRCLSEQDIFRRTINIYSFYSAAMKVQLFQPWLQQQVTIDGGEALRALQGLQEEVQNQDPVTQMLYLDTRTNLPDDLLMVADKTAMANSLETRVPFLDYRLVEFVESLTSSLKLRGVTGKYLHKKALAKWIPKQVVWAKKKGFANPLYRWLQAPLLPYLKQCLLDEGAAVGRYFSQQYIGRMIAEHESGARNHMRHLYLLLSFELWHQQFITGGQPVADWSHPQLREPVWRSRTSALKTVN